MGVNGDQSGGKPKTGKAEKPLAGVGEIMKKK